MRGSLAYFAGAAASFAGGALDVAYINEALVPRLVRAEAPAPPDEVDRTAPATSVEARLPVPPPAIVSRPAPPPEPPAPADARYEPVAVRFATDSASLDARAGRILTGLAHRLRSSPELVVRIEGHADRRGSRRFNQRLSERRAEAIARALARRGVPRERIEAIGFGEERAEGVPGEHYRDRRADVLLRASR